MSSRQEEKVPILLVDDHPENLLALEAVLDRPDYALVRANSGQEALEILQSRDFSVILLDIQMPVLDGFQTAKLIRERKRSAHTPIIFITASIGENDRVYRGYEAGAVDYLFKPFDPLILRAKVAIFADLYRKDQKLKRQEELLRQEKEENLRLAREQIRAILTHAPLILFSIDRKGIFTLSEGRGLERLGLVPGQVVGKSVFEIYEDSPWIIEGINRAIEGEALTGEGKIGNLWFEAHYSPIRSDTGEIQGVIGAGIDITERKQGELASQFLARVGPMMASSLDYKTTLEKIPELALGYFDGWCAVHLVNPDGTLVTASVTHSDPKKVGLARALEARYPVNPDAPAGAPNVIRTEKVEWMTEIPDSLLIQNAKDAEHLRILQELGLKSYICVPLRARGRVFGAITFVAADHAYSEKDLRLAQELAGRFALALDNAKLYQEAQEAIRVRDEFISIASHELKTPLTGLKLQTQMAKRIYFSPDTRASIPERLLRLIEVSEKQTDRLAKLVEDMLDISRIENRKLLFNMKDVNLSELLKEVLHQFTDQLQAASCALDSSIEPEIHCTADSFRIEQVMVNLLTNAMKYGARKPIHVSLMRQGDRVKFVVRDQGIGIKKENQDRIFRRFERAVSASSISGLGLGLYLVKQIVEAHQGRVGVESELGKGSTFTVELPCAGEVNP